MNGLKDDENNRELGHELCSVLNSVTSACVIQISIIRKTMKFGAGD